MEKQKNDYCLFYTTMPSLDQSKSMGQTLLNQKLAACVNILPQVSSIYWWEDKICESQEHILLIKSKKLFFKEIEQQLSLLHPYDTPILLQINIDQINKTGLQWLQKFLSCSPC